jgi:hypothetical protein
MRSHNTPRTPVNAHSHRSQQQSLRVTFALPPVRRVARVVGGDAADGVVDTLR